MPFDLHFYGRLSWLYFLLSALSCSIRRRIAGAGIEPATSRFRAWRHVPAATAPQSRAQTNLLKSREVRGERRPQEICRAVGSLSLPDSLFSSPLSFLLSPALICRPTGRQIRGEGFEPSSPASKAGSLPLADPRATRSLSCGGRNRTCVGAVNSRLPVPARAPPQSQSTKHE